MRAWLHWLACFEESVEDERLSFTPRLSFVFERRCLSEAEHAADKSACFESALCTESSVYLKSNRSRTAAGGELVCTIA